MTSQDKPHIAIDAHKYGLKAAAAKNPHINKYLISPAPSDIVKSIALIDQIADEDQRDLFMEALINYSTTGDRETAAEPIKRTEYLAAHYRLAKLLRAMRVRWNQAYKNPMPLLINIEELPTYLKLNSSDADFQPATEPITENLYETVQASNAPSAAISAATRSI